MNEARRIPAEVLAQDNIRETATFLHTRKPDRTTCMSQRKESLAVSSLAIYDRSKKIQHTKTWHVSS